MALKLQNKKEFTQYLFQQAERMEQALVYNLEALVAELENHAKLSAEYKDQTSNLKSSIGGVVLQNGKPVTYKGFTSGTPEGNTTGMNYINSLIPNYPKGFVLLVVAGMDYAAYVEDIHNLNVLKKTELKMAREIPVLLNRLKSRFKK